MPSLPTLPRVPWGGDAAKATATTKFSICKFVHQVSIFPKLVTYTMYHFHLHTCLYK